MSETAHVQGKVLGFRSWTVDGYRLLSANPVGGHWRVGVNKAECRRDRYVSSILMTPRTWDLPADHVAPHPGCECGLYAWHHAYSSQGGYVGPPMFVYGAILAWGHIEVHEDGFRAEYAEPVAFAYHPRQPYEDVERLKAFAGEMSMPLLPLGELEAAALTYGSPVAEDLRPRRDYGLELHNAMAAFHSAIVVKSNVIASFQQSAAQASAAMRNLAAALQPAEPRAKGPKQRLKTPGPPGHGAWRNGDTVIDGRRREWLCVASGKPGSWTRVD